MGDIVRRGTVWYVRYKDADGTRRMRASHQPTREAARRYLLAIEGRIARGVVGIPEPTPAAPTVAELTERFLRDHRRPRIKDLVLYRGRARTCLKRALPTLGGLRCDAVTPRDIGRLRDELAQRCAPGSAGLTLTYLKTLFAWARRERIIETNPLLGVELPRRAGCPEYLSSAEVRALLDTADRQAAAGAQTARMLRTCVHFAVRTGLRKGELFGLRWRDLDLDSGRLDVLRSYRTTPKSDKPRHLRLPADVLPILREWQSECPRTPEGLVFPRQTRDGVWGMPRSTTFMGGLPELMAAAGLRPLARAWHALRHTFASHYIMSGGNILTLQRILGHADIKHTLAYAHLAPDFLGAEMSRIKF